MASKSRRPLLVGFGAIAGVIALTATSWACTQYYGNSTVTGNGSGNVSKTIVGINSEDEGLDMTYCESTPLASASESTKDNFWTARVNNASESVTLSVSTASCGGVGGGVVDRMQQGSNYVVRLLAGYQNEAPYTNGGPHNCHGFSGGTVLTSSFAVDGNGAGTGTYTPTMSAGWYSICVYKADGLDAQSQNFKVV